MNIDDIQGDDPMTNHIVQFFHCRQCLEMLPKGMTPRDFARFECGWTTEGLQVWCTRHNVNVVDLDFHGQKVSFAGEPKLGAIIDRDTLGTLIEYANEGADYFAELANDCDKNREAEAGQEYRDRSQQAARAVDQARKVMASSG